MVRMLCRIGLLAGLWGVVPSQAALSQEAPPAAAKVTYEEHVRPIFREHCFSCHNQDKAKSDLVIDSYAAMMRGGASGEVIEPGNPDGSRLYLLMAHKDTPEMPPEQDMVAAAKLETIRKWIEGGALENSGSTAKASNKPKMEMAPSTGGQRPEGPPPMPEKLSRQPVVYTPRAAAVTAIAASPWAPLVAVAGQRQISLYNSDTTEFLGVLPFPEGVPQVLKFSRGGSLLLAGGGRNASQGLVAVYDVKTGTRIIQVGDELDSVLAADINDNNTLIALGGAGKVVRVYSTADGSLVQEIRKHTDWVYSLEFSPDGVLLATADRNGGMFVWEADTGREYQNLKGHTGAINDVSWRIDSNVLASCSEDGTIRLWEMNNGSQIKSWAGHGGGCASIEYGRDGRLVSIGRDRQAKIFDENGAAQRAFDAMNDLGLEVVFTHDGARVAAGDWSGEVRLWDSADGKLVGNLPPNPPTLEMASQAAAANAAAAAQLAQAGTAELTALQQAAAQKAEAAKAAAEKFAASQAEADKAEADKLAGEQAAADQAASEKAAAVATLTQAATAAQEAANQLAAELAALPATGQ